MELYHVVSFVLTYFVLGKCDYEKLEDDPLFNVIPSMNIPTGFSVRAVSHPHDSVDIQSEKFVYTEHVSVGLSYYLFSKKSMMYALEITRSRTAVSRQHRNVVRPHVDIRADHTEGMMIIGYGMIAGLTYVTVGSRKTSSDLIFFDILLAHLMFYFSERW